MHCGKPGLLLTNRATFAFAKSLSEYNNNIATSGPSLNLPSMMLTVAHLYLYKIRGAQAEISFVHILYNEP